MEVSAAISGSFTKFLNEINKAILEMKRNGIRVISPKYGSPKKSSKGFLYLEHNRGRPSQIEHQHLQAISRSNFLYVVNPTGYVGPSATLEIGYALSLEIPVFSSDPPSEHVLSLFVTSGKKLPEIKRLVSRSRPSDSRDMSIRQLERYVAELVKQKKFHESITQKFILFTEEVGELSHAVRFMSGLKTPMRHGRARAEVSEEIADCMIYLVDMANALNLELASSLREKLSSDLRRKWRAC